MPVDRVNSKDSRPLTLSSLISFVVDGRLCDGGDARQQGWTRYQGDLGGVAGSGALRVGPPVKSLRVYGRYLRTSEAVANYHGGP